MTGITYVVMPIMLQVLNDIYAILYLADISYAQFKGIEQRHDFDSIVLHGQVHERRCCYMGPQPVNMEEWGVTGGMLSFPSFCRMLKSE